MNIKKLSSVEISVKEILSIHDMVNRLQEDFASCKIFKDTKQGGQMRAEKARCWERFMIQILLHVIAANNSSYVIRKGHKHPIQGDFAIEMDISIFSATGHLLYHVEVKDYVDTSMYKRNSTDNRCLMKSGMDKMGFIVLSGWVAIDPKISDEINNIMELDGKVILDTLLPNKRVSKDNLFILDQSYDDLIFYTKELINRLKKVIV